MRTFTLIIYLLVPMFLTAASDAVMPEKAKSHLVPAESYFSSYDFQHKNSNKVRNELLKDVSHSHLAQVVYLPSFQSASALILQSDDRGKPILMYLEYGLNNKDQALSSKVIINKSSKPVSVKLAKVINQLWMKALSTTRYPKKSLSGLDGESFYFSAFGDHIGLRAGWAWSPDKDSLPYDLLQIAQSLRELISKQSSIADEESIIKNAEKLLTRIPSEG